MTPALVRRVRFVTVERLEEVARNGFLGGYAAHVPYMDDPEGLKPRRWVRLELAMDCEEPYQFVLAARYSARHGKRLKPMIIEVNTRCRKCFSCKRRRGTMWAARAIDEWSMWPITMMGTFTLSVDNHLELDNRARKRLWSGRTDFDRLTESERFGERAKEFGIELTAYIKRLRKGDLVHVRPQFRYLLIAERHESEKTSGELLGRPHYHILFHEKEAGALVKGNPAKAVADGIDGEWEKRMVKSKRGWVPAAFASDEAFIRKNWTLGFTKFQWAETAASAYYVCKYLSKSMDVRVRPSNGYGRLNEVRQQPIGLASKLTTQGTDL